VSRLLQQVLSLWLQIDYMSEDDARWIFQQLIVAVDYCHRLGIANRDIKVRHDMQAANGSTAPSQSRSCAEI
jgi:serine/threonine protein kinase